MDLRQPNFMGNCFMISVLQNVAENDPDHIRSIISTTSDPEHFKVDFGPKGCWTVEAQNLFSRLRAIQHLKGPTVNPRCLYVLSTLKD